MIRRAAASESDWMTRTAAVVYAPLGDYGRILPGWIAHPGVLAFVEAEDATPDRPRGFILVGFYSGWSDAIPAPPGQLVADLLAIAVAPEHQRRGIGTRLLDFAVELVEEAAVRTPVVELRLTVADTNLGAQRLFRRKGFEVLDEHHGAYDGGQRAIRMRRKITPARRSPAGQASS
jgi:ribosomal protein S18 acetylase RimI-like enzyme